MKRSKKYKQALKHLEKEKLYPIEEALDLLRKAGETKFDSSIEVHINLNIDPKNGEQQVRGLVNLPHGTGKNRSVAVFTENKQEEAKKTGAQVVGGSQLIKEIAESKKIDFDIAVADPDIMKDLAKIAKILGPKGLMPSPKAGTVTADIEKTVKDLLEGQVSFKNDDTGNIHQVIGKLSWDIKKLKENFEILLNKIKSQRPAGIKGDFIKSISLCSSMSPSIKVEF